MSPDATTTTSSAAEPHAAPPTSASPTSSEAPSPAPAPAAEPARAGADRTLNTLQDAFRASPDALKERGAGRTPDAADKDEAPPGASASPDDASKPGGDERVSRRGAAAKISEQQAEIDRLVAERERERERTAAAEAKVREHAQAREQSRQAALSRIGDDRTFAELSSKRMRGQVLSYEDDQKLDAMLAWREHASDLWEMTDRAHKADLASRLGDRVERYGLDRETAYGSALPELVDHVAQAVEARVKAESANEIAELKAELKGLRTRAGKAGAPTVGGASAPGSDAVPPDGSSPLDFFRAGARQQEAASARAAAQRR